MAAYLREHESLFKELSDSTDTEVSLEPEQVEQLKALGYVN